MTKAPAYLETDDRRKLARWLFYAALVGYLAGALTVFVVLVAIGRL